MNWPHSRPDLTARNCTGSEKYIEVECLCRTSLEVNDEALPRSFTTECETVCGSNFGSASKNFTVTIEVVPWFYVTTVSYGSLNLTFDEEK